MKPRKLESQCWKHRIWTQPVSLDKRPPSPSFLGLPAFTFSGVSFLAPPLPSPDTPSPLQEMVWEHLPRAVRAALLGELWNPRLAQGSTIISKAGNQVSSQSPEVYLIITANYLCHFNLCFVSFGEKRPRACFHGIFFSLTRDTWHSISPGRRHVAGSFPAVPTPSPAQPSRERAWSSPHRCAHL